MPGRYPGVRPEQVFAVKERLITCNLGIPVLHAEAALGIRYTAFVIILEASIYSKILAKSRQGETSRNCFLVHPNTMLLAHERRRSGL